MKNILLVVCGSNPQVILGAMSTLYVTKDVVIDQIIAITNTFGKEKILEQLFDNNEFDNFLKSHGLNTEFSKKDIIVPTNESNGHSPYFLTHGNNDVILQRCFNAAYELSKDNNCRIFFLLNNELKSISSCLALAAQIYGRTTDSIYAASHSNNYDAATFDSYSLYVVNTPHLALYNKLNINLGSNIHPSVLLQKVKLSTNDSIFINLDSQEVSLNGITCKLSSALFALYLFFVNRKLTAKCKTGVCNSCTECFLSLTEILEKQPEITSLYRSLAKNCNYNLTDTGITELSKENFNSYKSKLKNIFIKKFGAPVSKDLAITSVGKRHQVRLGISAHKKQLQIVGENA